MNYWTVPSLLSPGRCALFIPSAKEILQNNRQIPCCIIGGAAPTSWRFFSDEALLTAIVSV
jgi:hypothetical protein